MAVDGDAILAQRRLQCSVAGDARRLVAAVPVDGDGAGGTNQSAQMIQGVAGQQVQIATLRRQLAAQRFQPVVQPPTAGGAGCPWGFLIGSMDAGWQDPVMLGARRDESRIVCQPQVTSE